MSKFDELDQESEMNLMLIDAIVHTRELWDEGFFDDDNPTVKDIANKAIDITCEQHSIAVSPEIRAAMLELWTIAIVMQFNIDDAYEEITEQLGIQL